MISILDSVHQYVPTETHVVTTDVSGSPGNSETVEFPVDDFHYIVFGGDQLTAKRAQEAQNICSNSQRGKDHLNGLFPIIEDWHAKVCLLGVSAQRMIISCLVELCT